MARKRLSPAQSLYLDNPTEDAVGGEKSEPVKRKPLGPPIAQVAAESASESALRNLADDISKARADGRMVIEIPIKDIAPDHLARDRVFQSGEDLNALMASLKKHGQRTPIEVTEIEGPYRYGLISGWRRISALEKLNNESDDGSYLTVLALLRHPKDSADAYVSMVEENEIRVGLSYYERARVAGEAVKRGVFATEKEALLTLFATASRPKRSRIRSFLDIYHALDGVLQHPAAISERQGLALVQALRADESLSRRLQERLSAVESRTAEGELLLLSNVSVPRAQPQQEQPNVPHAEHLKDVLENGLNVSMRNGKISISGQGVSVELWDQLKAVLSQLDLK